MPSLRQAHSGLQSLVPVGLAFMVCLIAGVRSYALSEPPLNSRALQVRFIEFTGNEAIPAGELKKIMTTKEMRFRWFTKAHLDEQSLREDADRIAEYYRSQGFYHAEISRPEITPIGGNEVKIKIEIHEGPPMIISELELEVSGDTSVVEPNDLLKIIQIHQGDRFTTSGYQEIEKSIMRFYSNLGYPKAKVDLAATLNKATNQASVAVVVSPGDLCTFGPIHIEGNESVKDEVILRELTFHHGDRFDGSKIQESQQRLFNLDLFQFLDLTVEGLDEDTSVLPIQIVVKEAKKNTVRVGIGYGTDEEFRGQIQYQIRNFLGDGRRLQVNAKASSIGQLVEGEFLQPYLLTQQSYLTLSGGLENQDQISFTNRRVFVTPTYNYRWTDRFSSFLGYDLETNRLVDVKLVTPLRGLEDQEREEYFVSSLVTGNSWEQVDIPANPKKGIRFFETVEWAGSEIGSEVDFVKIVLEGRGYLPVGKFGVLASKFKWGGIRGLGTTSEVPIFKRFFSGGSDSVRGYPYQRLGPLDSDGNPVGGMTLVEGNAEWRFPVKKLFEGVLFFDFGNVFLNSFDVTWGDLRYTAGCGIRYLTLVGPLRLDFGYELNPPKGDYFSPLQVHFSIGQAF